MNGVSTNKGVITLITTTVAVMAFAAVVTICVMSYFGIKIPPELNTLAGGLVGSLGGMLVKTSPTETMSPPPHPTPNSPTPVQVVNQPENPVPVEPQP